MIAIPLSKKKTRWHILSFPSTLYLCPILDLLLAQIPQEWQPEIRLGLQEALVNAAKHGNQLDPNKSVIVRFLITEEEYSWVICDQGNGFTPNCNCHLEPEDYLPADDEENGRGLCLLYQIFDRVDWNNKGTELRLGKQIKDPRRRKPLLC